MKRTKALMIVSGLLGFSFFLIANFTQVLYGLDVLSGCIQIAINIFVFLSWKQGYLESKGSSRLPVLVGTIVPVIMATITIVRVIIPAIIERWQ